MISHNMNCFYSYGLIFLRQSLDVKYFLCSAHLTSHARPFIHGSYCKLQESLYNAVQNSVRNLKICRYVFLLLGLRMSCSQTRSQIMKESKRLFSLSNHHCLGKFFFLAKRETSQNEKWIVTLVGHDINGARRHFKFFVSVVSP